MKTLKTLSWLIIILIFASANISGQEAFKRVNLFDSNWKFHRGGALGAESISFDDSKWRDIDLPHDWSIEDLPGTNSPFNVDAISQVNGGFTTGGTGWYRKKFSIPAELKDSRILIMFEGVYMNSDVWVNGKLLGNHPFGYTSFWYDISGTVKYGQENIIAVSVKNEGENSRWYSGSGIYRHVWLSVVPPVHVSTWGTYITTPEVNEKEALIQVKASVTNSDNKTSKFSLVTKIFGPDGQQKGEVSSEHNLDPAADTDIVQKIKIAAPLLWSPDKPQLYRAVLEIKGMGKSDLSETTFGIRSISFDTANGFKLNGKTIKLKGGCVHHDNGILGSRAYDRAEERRVELLKASGFNAIRCSHNPPSVSFLDACDRLGMLVIDESFDMWSEGKNPADYHLYFNDWWKKDTESMVFRDRNHPSIILWSIGNEIPDRKNPEVIKLAEKQAAYVRWLDPTRPVTSAVNNLSPEMDPYFAVLDIGGYNYAAGVDHKEDLYAVDHKRLPARIMVGTESYAMKAFDSWMAVKDHPFVIGDFVWTAFDYIGEASIGWRGYLQKQNFFPWNLAYCGDIDICGWKRAQSYYRDALWKENQVSIWVTAPKPSFELNPDKEPWSLWNWYDVIDDWSWKGSEGTNFEVIVYSSCESVELFLNNKSLGKKIIDRSTAHIAKFLVPYSPGVLRVVGYRQKKQVASAELLSAGEPARIKLTADRSNLKSDNQDLSYITVEVTDNNNVRNPKAENPVTFELSGPGTIAGTGNANPVSLESYQQSKRNAWHGRCMVIIKSGTGRGKIILKATSPGLEPAILELESN